MQQEIFNVISKSRDKKQIEIMKSLQNKIIETRDLLLPELNPSPDFNNDRRDLQCNIDKDYILSKNFRIFVLDCLVDVAEAEKSLSKEDTNSSSDSESSCWQLAIKCLTFLLHKMYKLLTIDHTPIYQNGWYNGLFGPNGNISTVRKNLEYNERLTKFDQNMKDENAMQGKACWDECP